MAGQTDVNDQARIIWDRNAAHWDEYFGDEGNLFHRTLVGPTTERLLGVQPGEVVLDAACGNGVFSRRLAELGASVLAFDFSQEFIERALARGDSAGRIEYRVLDATSRDQLLRLGEGRFDAAVATMALMDMADIEPLVSSIQRLLKPDGRFVFSIMHPCFNSVGTSIAAELTEDADGRLAAESSVRVREYLRTGAQAGTGVPGQPVPQLYFHRPLSVLLGTCFRAGLVLDGLEEPAFSRPGPEAPPLSWTNLPGIPPILVARLRLA